MGPSATIPANVVYRVALVREGSPDVLVTETCGGYCLPSVSIPPATRPAQELRRAIHAWFGIDALILDLSVVNGCLEPFAVAEIRSCGSGFSLVAVDLASVPVSALSERERRQIEAILRGTIENPFARIGWIRDAIEWVENATGSSFSPCGHFDQYNAGPGFSLIRFQMNDGAAYWLKATSGSNRHELAVTSALSNLCGKFLPSLVDTKPIWNAWITREEAARLEVLPKSAKELLHFLRSAVDALAAVQIRTAGQTNLLLAAGAFDQRAAVLSTASAAFFSYLEEAMAEQQSTNAPRVGRKRLQELSHIFEDSCTRLEALGLPTTVIHGDMNPGNILVGTSHYQLIDWAETYVGSPLATFQHLLLLNQAQDESVRTSIESELRGRYRRRLLTICEAGQIDEAFLFMPLVAAFSALYGRGNWLDSPLRYDPRRQRYARTLARHIDRAAQEPQLLSALGVGRTAHSPSQLRGASVIA